jgi:hypothetical protein
MPLAGSNSYIGLSGTGLRLALTLGIHGPSPLLSREEASSG